MNDDKWTRQGECNHCGACCLFLHNDPIQLGIDVKETSDDRKKLLALRGFRPNDPQNLTQVTAPIFLYNPCTEYRFPYAGYNGSCRIWGQVERPQACTDFPSRPSQIINTPCSYWFERPNGHGGVHSVGGQGSPYPGEQQRNAGGLALKVYREDERPLLKMAD